MAARTPRQSPLLADFEDDDSAVAPSPRTPVAAQHRQRQFVPTPTPARPSDLPIAALTDAVHAMRTAMERFEERLEARMLLMENRLKIVEAVAGAR